MKIFVEIVSCKKDRWKQFAPRNTWIAEWGHLVDYKFLLGDGNENEEADEWILAADDSWDGKAIKIQAAHRKILEAGYDYVFHISLDCYPIVPRLLMAARELRGHPYVGSKSGGGDFLGEAGFWMGREALQAIVAAPAQMVSYDDQWMGEVLHKAGIRYCNVPGYEAGDQQNYVFPYAEPSIWQNNQQISVHLGRGSGTFQPQWMFDCHKSYMEGGDHNYPRLGL